MQEAQQVHLYLANIWFFIIGLVLVLYVVLDGFDLGVGILSLFEGREQRRGMMMASLGSVWDANETWLVLLGGALFGAFPVVYGVVLHALYVPILLMIFGLIFRGIAFEFREHASRKLWWNAAFGGGSLVAAASQGLVLGALLEGIEVRGGQFAGGVWDWLSPFSLLIVLGVVAGYTLLGAAYLVLKTEGDLQRRAAQRARIAAWLTVLAGAGVTVWTPLLYDYIAQKWFSPPTLYYLTPLPLFAAFAFFMLLRALRRGYEHTPFLWSLAIFVTSFIGLALSLYPYIVPPYLTVTDAAASGKTLVFMLAGIGMLIPIMLVYNGYQYLVFRGKVRSAHYQD
jgi:cytochrome d ubiquinol oxidase subunit II